MEPRLLYAADIAPLTLALNDMGAHAQPLAPVQAAVESATQGKLSEWVFIDAGIPDLQAFLRDFNEQVRHGRDLTVVVFQSDEDGVTRITQALAHQQGVGAVHILSHGSDGAVQLGSTSLNTQALMQRSNEIALWGTAMSEGADLMLYGCEVASDAKGQAFLQGLAALTSAQVAASSDITGAGGNWTLEHSTGQIDTQLAVSTRLTQHWEGQLAQATGPSKGLAVWSDANTGGTLFRQWDGTSLSATSATQSSANFTVITSAWAPDERSAIVLGVTSDGVIQGGRWTGTQWEAIPLNPLASGVLDSRQGFAVAYEQNSGDAMIVWNDGTTLKYATYTSSGWSVADTVAAYTGAEPQRIQIAAQPKGDQLLITVSDKNVNDRALVWSGTSWGPQIDLDTTGGDFLEQLALSTAYEASTGDAHVFYAKTGDSTIYQRIFSGGNWGQELSLTTGITGRVVNIVATSDLNSDRIGLGVMSQPDDSNGFSRQEAFARWSGTAWEAVTTVTGSTAIGGTTLSVAFEGKSGDLLAAYIGGGNAPTLRTLQANANAWSGSITGPDMGNTLGAIRLFADPVSDQIMLGMQTTGGKLSFAEWGGQSIVAVRDISNDTGNAFTPAFTWFWQPQYDNTANTSLWVGSAVDSTGWPGLNQVFDKEILSLDSQGLTLGANASSGTFSRVWNPAAMGVPSLDDMAWVSQPVSLLSGFSFQRGDILFTVGASTNLQGTNNVPVNDNDVVRFRPTVAGDYSRGAFTVVYEGLGAGLYGNGSTPDIKGLALVEQDVVVGDRQLRAGSFLFTAGNGSNGRDIYVQSYSTFGLALINSTTRLVIGSELGLSESIDALEVITVATTLGGQSLAEGDLLITLSDDDTIASNQLAVERRDVVTLSLSRTSVNSSAVGSARLLLDGSAMGTPDVRLDGLALRSAASPVITSGTNPIFEVSAAENQRTVTTVTAQDSQGGSNVSFAIVGGADAASFTIGATDGKLEFKSQNVPDREAPTDSDQDGVYEVLVQASEGSKADQQRIRVSITDVNEAPVINASTLNLTATELQPAETTLATITALDPEQQALTYSISGGVDASYFQINSSTGELRFSSRPDTSLAPFAGHALTYAVQVAASDGTNTSTRAVQVTLNKVNRAPVNTVPGAQETLEDTALILQGLAVADNDAGNAPLTVTLTVDTGTLVLDTQVSGGLQASQVQISDGGRTVVIQASSAAINATLSASAGLTYLPAANAHGVDTLRIVTDDGGASGLAQQPEQRSDTDTVSIRVISVNDAPVLSANTGLSVTEGESAPLSSTILQTTDVDHSAADLRYSLVLGPGRGYLALAQSPQIALTGSNIFAQAQIDAGEVIYVHDGAEGQNDSFKLSVSDGAGAQRDDITVMIGITAVNDAPTITPLAPITVTEGQSVLLQSAQLSATDADTSSNALFYSVTQSGAHGYLALSGAPQTALTGANAFNQAQVDAGQIVYVHGGSEAIDDTLVLSLSDGQGGTVSGITLQVQVSPVNDAPVLNVNTGLTVTEGQSAPLSSTILQTTDADHSAADLRYSLSETPAHGYLALAQSPLIALTGANTFTQAQIDAGEVIYVHDGSEGLNDSFKLSVSDGAGARRDDITVVISVTAVNDAPTITQPSPITVTEGQSVLLQRSQLSAVDADNSSAALFYSITQTAAHGYLALSSAPQTALTGANAFTQAQVDAGQVMYVHDGSEAVDDTVVLSLSDGQTGEVSGITLQVQVTPVNDAPVLNVNAGLTVSEGQSTPLSSAILQATDADHSAAELRYSLSETPAHGYLALAQSPLIALTGTNTFTQAQINAGEVIYVHDGSESLNDSLMLSVSDGQGSRIDNLVVEVRVTPVNDAPQLLAHALTIEQGGIATPRIELSDDDTPASQIQLTFSEVRAGRFVDLSNGQTIERTSLADLRAGKVAFVQDGSANAPSYLLTITDDGGNVATSMVSTSFMASPAAPALATGLPATSSESEDEATGDTTSESTASATQGASTAVTSTLNEVSERLAAQVIFVPPPQDNLSDAVAGVRLQPSSNLPEVTRPANRTSQESTEAPAEFIFRWTGSLSLGQASQELSRSLAELHETLKEASENNKPFMASSIALSTGLSVGYVIWLVRGGALVGSMLSSMPLWSMVDPLPVLSRSGNGPVAGGSDDDEDSPLENLFDGNGAPPPPPSPPSPPPQAQTGSDGQKDPT